MTWEILTGLILLVTFLITVGKLVAGNTEALTKLKDSIAALDKTLSETKTDVSHLDERVDDHEIRITVLETK